MKPEIEIGKVILEVADEMGLFDKIKKGFDKAVKFVGKKIADIFGLETKKKTETANTQIKHKAEERSQEIHKQIKKNAQKVAEVLGDESYDVETANAREIRLMNEELYEMQESIKIKASGMEEDIIEHIHGTVHDMLEQLESVNESAGLNLNMAYLNSMETSLRNQVTGFIQNRVKRSLSLDNPECKDILKMEGKTAKQMAMQRFQDKIFADAVNDLWELVKDIFTEKNSAIFTQIENRFTTIEMNAEESIRHTIPL